MKVALDTNVLLSAYTARGISADVFRLILAEHELILPEIVLLEFERVAISKFGIPKRFVAELLDELRSHQVVPQTEKVSKFSFIRDPSDRIVVNDALVGEASVLITGDRDILDVREKIANLQVFTPREFWESIRRKD